jgi:predicted metalloprotease with PDZ domain
MSRRLIFSFHVSASRILSLGIGAFLAPISVMFFLFVGAVSGQNSAGPQPAPMPPPIAAPADIPYPGIISLMVDATNVNDRIFEVRETIPVAGREITLLYPEWLPGSHSPSNPIAGLAGLVVKAKGERIAWKRDPVNMYAFHVEVPPGANALDVSFQYLGPIDPKRGRISEKFADLTWISVVVYPAGCFSRNIKFDPALRIPLGWKYATALETVSEDGNLIHFKTTTLNTLIDSPLYAGENFKRVDLSTGADNKVYLDVFADKPDDMEITPDELQYHKNLVIEVQKLFNSHHYEHYDFLFSVSDIVGGDGLEHHQSSEDGSAANYFTDWTANIGDRDLLPHEYTHSWNGKFRRPADLWTPNFNVPMRNSLLWVYEGLTDYYGNVLAARSGLRTPEQARDVWAAFASDFEHEPGRIWRSLEDTTDTPIISRDSNIGENWPSWQREEDYYPESDLIWLEADTKIREMSNGAKSLDDFAKAFYGINNGSFVTVTYTFDDLLKALNAIEPFDWRAFFRARVFDVASQVPENGFSQGGYRLVYNDTQPDSQKHPNPHSGSDFSSSIGFSVSEEGDIETVVWNGPAFKAGITPQMHLEAVNDQKYTPDLLRETILAGEKNQQPMKLLLKRGDDYRTVSIDYHGGMRYPHLQRVEGTPDRLDAILAPAK